MKIPCLDLIAGTVHQQSISGGKEYKGLRIVNTNLGLFFTPESLTHNRGRTVPLKGIAQGVKSLAAPLEGPPGMVAGFHQQVTGTREKVQDTGFAGNDHIPPNGGYVREERPPQLIGTDRLVRKEARKMGMPRQPDIHPVFSQHLLEPLGIYDDLFGENGAEETAAFEAGMGDREDDTVLVFFNHFTPPAEGAVRDLRGRSPVLVGEKQKEDVAQGDGIMHRFSDIFPVTGQILGIMISGDLEPVGNLHRSPFQEKPLIDLRGMLVLYDIPRHDSHINRGKVGSNIPQGPLIIRPLGKLPGLDIGMSPYKEMVRSLEEGRLVALAPQGAMAEDECQKKGHHEEGNAAHYHQGPPGGGIEPASYNLFQCHKV